MEEQECEVLHEETVQNVKKQMLDEDILFDVSGYVKLTDFGIARTWSPNNSNDTSGTPGYMGI